MQPLFRLVVVKMHLYLADLYCLFTLACLAWASLMYYEELEKVTGDVINVQKIIKFAYHPPKSYNYHIIT